MSRAVKSGTGGLPQRTLVLDNGAYSMKAGFVKEDISLESDCHVIPNCIARGSDGGRGTKVYIADQLDACRDFGEMVFRRPVEKGFIVNWDCQSDIWKHVFFDQGSRLHCEPHETNLILTEAPNCSQALQNNCDQMVFEEFEFASLYRCIGSTLNAYNDISILMGDPATPNSPAECILLIDSGYSHTTITPLYAGHAIPTATRRLDIGGKFLTNRLKELISLRHLSLMDESHLVSQIKEEACFVSADFKADMDRAWKGTKGNSTLTGPGRDVVVDYALPDYVTTFRGEIRPHDPRAITAAARHGGGTSQGEVFPLGNERFTVPELLFSPRDVGMAQAGIAEAVAQSLNTLPLGWWPGFLANVVVVGGNARLRGFMERLESELRQLVPDGMVLRVRSPPDPVKYTWLGGARMAADREVLRSAVVTREDYQEYGSAWTARQFSTFPAR